MKKIYKASVLIYSLILVNVVLILSMVVLNNTFLLETNYKFHAINQKISNMLLQKSDLSFKYSSLLNSNGSGFIDNLSCPDSITMSGTINKNTGIVSSLVYNSGNIYCQASYSGNDIFIYFDTDYTDYITATYISDMKALTSTFNKTGVATFSDGDSTLISFNGTSYLKSDGIDDNFDSDNYMPDSDGVLPYPNGYIDDDSLSRTSLYGYVNLTGIYQNVFWNNSKMEDYIDNNVNNTGSTYVNMKNGSGYVYLDIDNFYDIKVVEFDKIAYSDSYEMIPLVTNEAFGQASGIGYLQDDLTISSIKTGNEYLFDFSSTDYGIFLKNDGVGTLLYNVTVESTTGSGMFINPIDDSDGVFLKYLGGNIIINEEGLYISKQMEIIGKK